MIDLAMTLTADTRAVDATREVLRRLKLDLDVDRFREVARELLDGGIHLFEAVTTDRDGGTAPRTSELLVSMKASERLLRLLAAAGASDVELERIRNASHG
ncbi:MAG: hypothetical protein IT516_12345 [Burkholderiales bacterium]|nr:hypothetical protein [Burkholderiales bacterium]